MEERNTKVMKLDDMTDNKARPLIKRIEIEYILDDDTSGWNYDGNYKTLDLDCAIGDKSDPRCWDSIILLYRNEDCEHDVMLLTQGDTKRIAFGQWNDGVA